MELSLKERKLINAISFNCRRPIASVAREVGLSKPGAAYLLDKLVDEKAILGFYPVINVMNLGYYYARLLVKTRNVRESDLKSIHAWLDNNSNWYLRTEGVYDSVIARWSESFEDFKDKANEFADRFSDKIDHTRECVCMELVQFRHRYIFDDGKNERLVMRKTGYVELDELDRRILRELAKNARGKIIEIAKAADSSPRTVVGRIAAMEKNNVLLGYRPRINTSLLGRSYYKVFFYFTRFKKGDVARFRNYLEAIPETAYVQTELGLSDLDVELILPSGQEFFRFMRGITSAFPGLVKDYEFVLVERESNISYLPFGF